MTARRILAPLLIALAVLGILLAGVAWLPLREARAAWSAGRYADAVSNAERWSQLQLWRTQYHQLLAAAWLSAGDDAAARPHLQSLARASRVWIPIVRKEDVARTLIARRRYAELLEYDAASHDLFESKNVVLYRAAALTALNRLSDAEKVLSSIDRGAVDPAKLDALTANLAARKSGSFPIVLGRDRKAIAVYQIANGDVVAVDRNFEPLVERAAGSMTIESRIQSSHDVDTIETTLDPTVQKAALDALGGFRGALVAIDPRTNELLAIVSNRGRGPLANLAIEQQYEPGSIIKVLTGSNAFANGVDLDYPYTCTGDLVIDGRHFGDWLPQGHGVVPDFDHALAESCNVIFADYGVRLGKDRLQSMMRKAGFDGATNLGVVRVPLGRTVGDIFNDFETAFYAIGLEHESVTPLHVAMLASMMANRGVFTSPRLVLARRSILGEPTAIAPPQTKVEVMPHDVAERMIQAMRAVVEDDEGTGRRAAIDGVSLALKTGTAGKREEGYHALILAFAPVESPKIAFGLVVEGSGPAEFAAAKIARDFLTAMKPRL